MKAWEKTVITDLFFDKETKRLSFIIKHYTYTPKIVRYVQENYVRTPIYSGYSERVKVVRKFDKVINPIKFVEKEILDLNLDKKFILWIIERINIIPQWRKKELELERISNLIIDTKRRMRDYDSEKKLYSFKKTNFNEKPSNFWLRFFFSFFTFGLSFIGFNSRKNASKNKRINKENKEWNAYHKVKIDQENSPLLEEITIFNKKQGNLLIHYQNLYKNVANEEIKPYKEELDGWKDLKYSSNFSFSYLNSKKGVYIIWNRTKDKHYVGQSKNLGKRLNQHFTNGEVKNVIFAKDWYAGDDFFYKYYLCQTKDELDALEKEKIEEYNSFGKGYNSTGGNR